MNAWGIDAAFLELDGALLEKLRYNFGLLAPNQLESATFDLPSVRWLTARGEVKDIQTTAEVARNGDDHWVRFAGFVRRTEHSTATEWAYPCANWFLPVAPDQLSIKVLSGMADRNRCLVEESPDSQDLLPLRANFLSAVSFHFLTTLHGTGQHADGFIRVLGDQVLPVTGLSGDILQLQAMLDDLDGMESHCLDLYDLADLFQDRDGAWQRLRVTAIGQGGSISGAIADILSEHPETSAWWFLFRSLESAKQINQAVKAMLPTDERVLMIPVEGDWFRRAQHSAIILVTEES